MEFYTIAIKTSPPGPDFRFFKASSFSSVEEKQLAFTIINRFAGSFEAEEEKKRKNSLLQLLTNVGSVGLFRQIGLLFPD